MTHFQRHWFLVNMPFRPTKEDKMMIDDSQDSAETLVRRGWITNNHLITYCYKTAKNYHSVEILVM